MKDYNKKQLEIKWNKGLAINTNATRQDTKENMKYSKKLTEWSKEKYPILMKNRTPQEIYVFSKLPKNMKRNAIAQYPFFIDGNIYFVDIFIKRFNIVIEVDGGYHNTPEQQEKDKVRDTLLGKLSIRVYRIKNEEVDDKEKFRRFKDMLTRIKPIKGSKTIREEQIQYLSNRDIIEAKIKEGTFDYSRELRYATAKAKRTKNK